MTIPEFSGDMELDNARIFQELEKGPEFDNVRYNAMLSAGGLTGIFTATSGILLAVFVLITRFFWVRIVTVVGFLINVILMFLTRGMVEKSLREEIRQKLSSAFKTLFYEIREETKKEFQAFSGDIRTLYRHLFSSAIDKPRHVFETRRTRALADFKKGREERVALAGEARRIREEQIQPLRISLQEFVSQVARVDDEEGVT